MPLNRIPLGVYRQKMSQFDPVVWAVGGGVPPVLDPAHLVFRALLYKQRNKMRAQPFYALEWKFNKNLEDRCYIP